MSKNVLAFFCADTHLQERAWSNRPTLSGDAYYAFTQIVDAAVEHGVPILHAGDLIDKRVNDSRPIDFLRKKFDQLEADKVEFFYIQGDHEYSEPSWVSAIHKWPTHLHGRICELSTHVSVYGIDYRPFGQFAPELAKMPKKANTLLTHQKWAEYLGGLQICEASFAKVPTVTTIVTGDFHVHGVAEYAGADGQVIKVHSPGSTCMQAINESFKHVIFALYPGGVLKPYPLKSRPVISFKTVTNETEFNRLLDTWPKRLAEAESADLPDNIRKPIVIAKFYDSVDAAYRRFSQVVGDSAHTFLSVTSPREEVEVIERKSDDTVIAAGLIGALPSLVPDTDSVVFRNASALLLSNNHREALKQMREKWFE